VVSCTGMAPSTIALVLRASRDTIASRFRSGPLFPGWSFMFESTARMLKLRARAVESLPLDEQRSLQEEAGEQEARRMRGKVSRSAATLGGISGEWFVPKDRSPRRVVLYLHGGGFMVGSSRTHAEMIMRIAVAADARVFAPNYRLAPEHAFPAQLDDCRAVYRALLAEGIAPGDLVVAGDSAGGNLTITLALALRDANEPLPAALAALSPWTDLPERGGSLAENTRYDWAAPDDFTHWMKNYVGDADPKNPLISPAYADLRGLPPMRVEVGTAEMLLDQVRAFVARAREASVRVDFKELPGFVHNGYLLAGYFPECQAAIDDLCAYLRSASAT